MALGFNNMKNNTHYIINQIHMYSMNLKSELFLIIRTGGHIIVLKKLRKNNGTNN